MMTISRLTSALISIVLPGAVQAADRLNPNPRDYSKASGVSGKVPSVGLYAPSFKSYLLQPLQGWVPALFRPL